MFKITSLLDTAAVDAMAKQLMVEDRGLSEDYEPDCEPDYYDTPIGLADNTAPPTTGGSHRSDSSNVQSLGSSNHSLPTHVATSKLRRRPPIFCGSCTTLPRTDCDRLNPPDQGQLGVFRVGFPQTHIWTTSHAFGISS